MMVANDRRDLIEAIISSLDGPKQNTKMQHINLRCNNANGNGVQQQQKLTKMRKKQKNIVTSEDKESVVVGCCMRAQSSIAMLLLPAA